MRNLNKSLSEDRSNYISGEEFFKQFRIEHGLPPREEKTEEQKMAGHNSMVAIQRENYAEMDLLGMPYIKGC